MAATVNRQLSTTNGATAHQPQLPRMASAPDLHGFPPMMPLGEFLFEYLHRCGVRHSFGIPGDFALPTFGSLEKSKIKSVTMTHEPSAGFAADAYARTMALPWFASLATPRSLSLALLAANCLLAERQSVKSWSLGDYAPLVHPVMMPRFLDSAPLFQSGA